MKANELAVGDWVCAKMMVINGEERLTPPMQVVALGETWVYLRIDPESGDPDEYAPSDIRPVPPIPDLLRANGWREVRPNCFSYQERDENGYAVKDMSVTFNPDGRIFVNLQAAEGIIIRRYITGVHELQRCIQLGTFDTDIVL